MADPLPHLAEYACDEAERIVATLLVASRTLRPHIVPVQTPPVPPVGSACSSSIVLKDEPVDREPRGFLHMITATIGWRDGVYSAPAPARTTDGGISWQPVAPWPVVVGPYKGVQAYLASCFLDANHAWVTERTESMPIEVDHLLVFRTTDGGQTWQQSAAISIGAAEIIRTELLTFIDDQHGWLFTEFQTGASNLGIRTVFATTDGGLRWIQVARATETDHTVLGGLNAGCSETGMNGSRLGRDQWNPSRLKPTQRSLGFSRFCCSPLQIVKRPSIRLSYATQSRL